MTALAAAPEAPRSTRLALIEGEPDDLARLAARSRDGDRAALEALLRASWDRAYPVCRRITGNDADAADATQEALVSVVKGIGRFDGRSRYSTWLYRVAVNASLDELRRRRRRSDAGAPGAPGAVPRPVDDAVADGVDVDAALRRLPAGFRSAVVLRDLCGLDYEEIAEILGVPPGTVRSRIARGRALLVGLLAPARSEER